jgi:hypothetical protein
MLASETRFAGAALVSVVVHGALLGILLAWLARAPVYRTPSDEAPSWRVQLLPSQTPKPRKVAVQKSARSAAPSILSKPASAKDLAPIVAAGTPGPTTSAPTSFAPENSDAATPEKVRRALRGSAVGCANMDRSGLNRQERQHCADRLGEGMAAMQRAMREAERGRLSLGGEPPKEREYRAYRDACSATGQRC